MFNKQCPNTAPHEPHEFDHWWEKQAEEPLGWFPPGSYASMPEPGHWSRYKCRGVASDG